MTEPDETDEDILNVLRESDEPYLKTAQVADSLSIGTRQTGGRLNELYEQDRVERDVIGRAHLWTLAPDELEILGDPEQDHFVRWHRYSKQLSRSFLQATKLFLWFGGAMVLVSLTATLQGTSVPFTTNSFVLAVGYVSILCSIIGLLIAGGLKLVSEIAAYKWAGTMG